MHTAEPVDNTSVLLIKTTGKPVRIPRRHSKKDLSKTYSGNIVICF